MSWVGLTMVAVAVTGITGSQIYLRAKLRSARRRKGVDLFVAVCACMAFLGYGAVTVDCVLSQACGAATDIANASQRRMER